MSYQRTPMSGMQSYQRTGGWKYGPTVWPSYDYYGGGPAYPMFGTGMGTDISNVWSFYVLPASIVVLVAWAALKIHSTMQNM